MQGINLTDSYQVGQLEASDNIGTARFPYISTVDEPIAIETGISEGYHAVSMFGWEKLFVVSNEPGDNGYKCYYGGDYCGDVKNLQPKQYAVVNSHLCVFPDRIMFSLYDDGITAEDMNTAKSMVTITSGVIDYRKAE